MQDIKSVDSPDIAFNACANSFDCKLMYDVNPEAVQFFVVIVGPRSAHYCTIWSIRQAQNVSTCIPFPFSL
jgi:hypothetical protein